MGWVDKAVGRVNKAVGWDDKAVGRVNKAMGRVDKAVGWGVKRRIGRWGEEEDRMMGVKGRIGK